MSPVRLKLIGNIQETCSFDFMKIFMILCMLVPVFLSTINNQQPYIQPQQTPTHPLPHNTIIILYFPQHVKIPEVTDKGMTFLDILMPIVSSFSNAFELFNMCTY